MSKKPTVEGEAVAAPRVIPKHLKKVAIDLDNYPKVDWDEVEEVMGKIVKIKHVQTKRKDSPEPVDTRFIVLETEKGRFNLWESAALSEFFDGLAIGQEIMVICTGEIGISGGRTMKTFEAYAS